MLSTAELHELAIHQVSFCLLTGTLQHKHYMLCRPDSKLACLFEGPDQLKLLFCVGRQGSQDSVRCQGNLYIA